MSWAGAIKHHWFIPSLRLTLAWAFFRAIDFFTATMIAMLVIGIIAIPMVIAAALGKYILLPLISFCANQ